MNDFENRILEVLEAYKAAVYERNVDTFLRLYDPEARVFDTWDDMVVRRRRRSAECDRTVVYFTRRRTCEGDFR